MAAGSVVASWAVFYCVLVCGGVETCAIRVIQVSLKLANPGAAIVKFGQLVWWPPSRDTTDIWSLAS